MKFELTPTHSYKIKVDEDAILDLFVNLGISRDKMEVDFDTHEYFTWNDGMIMIYIKEAISSEMSAKIEEMLENEFTDNNKIALAELTTDDDNLPCVNIAFTYPIYNENGY